ncbi:Os06g0610300 [Oryza sativa Japonica Group]|uniref:Os06g0610300 protein n=2 Tax=Oryza sativa subsp. japonica TaxID=39947 RepID=A0A0P0WYI9_ORYSJ|nr:hypothetical protein EE612_035279 [Oryza sativa]BAD35484.1 unknown protein [Oryza sativa Japonica Group]BAF19966.1 Os06g0610300 [Oryza sativa Japonica Group]BAS98576.1 Os06g0610300 [Oryza sativa Japonica Group]|eukprot:NP_001058052.1 Os06g0610300 [Oryza sativa Japonica Group]
MQCETLTQLDQVWGVCLFLLQGSYLEAIINEDPTKGQNMRWLETWVCLVSIQPFKALRV